MKSYEKIDDFLEDKSFKQWVLNGDAEQDKYWKAWIAAHPSSAELLGQAKTILLELDASAKKWEPQRQEKAFLAIKDKIKSVDRANKKSTYPIYGSYSSTIEKRVRAVITASLLMVFSVILLQNFLANEKEETITQIEKQTEWIIKSNPRGQKSSVQLPDGSVVVLNAESELRFKDNFGQGHRDIYLEGEAFFEVASDSLLPFSVHSGELITIALGTSFNINSYKENWVQVQLATGKVRVSNTAEGDQAVVLVAGEEVFIGTDKQLIKSKFDLEKAFPWKEGVLVFERIPFQEVVQVLERWYAAEIKVKNMPPNKVRISGEFKKNTYLKDVLESLGYAYNFDYSIKNKAVFIQFKQADSL